jgi:hypothetical protein
MRNFMHLLKRCGLVGYNLEDIVVCFTDYFSNLFKISSPNLRNEPPIISAHEQIDPFVQSIPDKEEILQVLKETKRNGPLHFSLPPGPTVFCDAAFNQAAPGVTGMDVYLHDPIWKINFSLRLFPRRLLLCCRLNHRPASCCPGGSDSGIASHFVPFQITSHWSRRHLQTV